MLVTSTEQFDQASKDLIKARTGLVKGAKSTGDLIGSYAKAMCVMFNELDTKGDLVTPWYELKGKAKAGIKDERAAFASEMLAAGFETPTVDVYWQRVKQASGYKTAANRVTGKSSVDEKTLAELKTIINRIFKAEEEGDSSCERSSDNKGLLIDVFGFMGGDIDTLG